MAPPIFNMGRIKLEEVLDAFKRSGIEIETHLGATKAGHVRFICRVGRASFVLSVSTEPNSEQRMVGIFADVSRYRWWNFPLIWLLAFRFTYREIKLQQTACKILEMLGGRLAE